MEKHSEALIIGGGVIGLASAYYLAKAGHKVRLLEQATIGAGASLGNCGLIVTSHLVPLCAPGAIWHETQRWLQGRSPLYIKLAPDKKRFMWLLNFARKNDRMLHVPNPNSIINKFGNCAIIFSLRLYAIISIPTKKARRRTG